MSEQIEGVLVMWSTERGFGFLRPANGDDDVFAGAGGFEAAGIEEPKTGERFFFTLGADRHGRARAESIRRPALAAPPKPSAPVRP